MNYKKIKRFLDIISSLLMLILVSPIFLAVSILNLIIHGRPLFFKQKRPGLKGKPFEMYKFRTMTNKKDKKGELLPDEQRITSYGKFLRKTSLDELPELFNVLKGDMSLIGPRPLLIKYLPYYTDREKARHEVRPGLTGLAQVSGRNLLDWEARLEKDVQYVENLSLILDLKILFKTIATVLQSENIELNAIDDLDDYRRGNSDFDE